MGCKSYNLLPYSSLNDGDTFTWSTDSSYTSYGFQLTLIEDYYVLPVDVNYWTDVYKYRVKVMDDVVVYHKRTDSTIYIGKLGSNTHLISRKLDTTSSAKFLWIYKSQIPII